MPAPRLVIPGRHYLLSRRCLLRQFLLRASKETKRILLYCLARAAARTGVRVIAFLFMSNHYHAVVQDVEGRLPEFLEEFHKLAARALNAHLGRWENLWSAEPPCATHLVTDEDVFEKVLYTLGNPVSDHLVERVHHWPGAHSLDAMLSGEPIHTKRPEEFFRKEGPTPPEIKLQLIRPPGFEGHSQEEWAAYLKGRISELELRAHKERIERGHGVLGKTAVLAASPFDGPRPSEPRRNLRPHIACKDPTLRVRAIRALQAFRRAYAKARELLLQGTRNVVFPYGTYHMRLMGLSCAGPPLAC